MSYPDWCALTKPFRIYPVAETRFEKDLNLTPVKAVGTLQIPLSVPAGTFTPYITNNSNPNIECVPVIVGQFCYTTTENFTILNFIQPTILNQNARIAICIRYRVGTAVVRYVLFQSQGFIAPLVFAPKYNGQLIMANFVIEVWQTNVCPTSLMITSPLINFLTGIIYIPTSDTDQGYVISPSVIVDYTDLTSSIPEILPIIVNPNGPWVTN